MCKYVPGVREIEIYLEHLSPKQAALKHKLLMNLDESVVLKKGVIIEYIEESRLVIFITKGSGSKLKKGKAKRGADDLKNGYPTLVMMNMRLKQLREDNEVEMRLKMVLSMLIIKEMKMMKVMKLKKVTKLKKLMKGPKPQHLRHHNPLNHRNYALRFRIQSLFGIEFADLE
ncbi:hypothetical protein DVH24_006481 [Malus domestica]|uniref:Uncharacterized protein n=1 Tax=Malus domestica TaxID=3750 RepID=A0A498KFN2_MALDO|nr:hypothetical protein DVH24_006481 [Malus domestica]